MLFPLDPAMRQVLGRLHIEFMLPDGLYEVHPDSVFEPPCQVAVLERSYHEVGAFTQVWSPLHNVVTVGRYCSIASGLVNSYAEHPASWLTSCAAAYQLGDERIWHRFKNESWDGPKDYTGFVFSGDDLPSHPITVGNDVWIGADVYLRRGIMIGDGAVIGARAVVTKDVPPFAIFAGNPARVRKWRFSEETRELLSELRWWEYCLLDFGGVPLWDADQAAIEVAERIRSGRLRKFAPRRYTLGERAVLHAAAA